MKKITCICIIAIAITLVPLAGCVYAEIDWVDFVKLNNITYIHPFNDGVLIGSLINDNDLIYYDKVKFNVTGVHNPNYKTKNGDAAYLKTGTALYSLKGYAPNFILIVKSEDRRGNDAGTYFVYETDTNTNAKKGGDLLDIKDKIDTIIINDYNSHDGEKTQLASITDMSTVSNLVDIVINASVDQNVKNGNMRYVIDFLTDDAFRLDIPRGYNLDTNVLGRGIILPDDFARIIRAALPATTATTSTYVTTY